MATSRIFDLINLELLSPSLAAQLKAAHTKGKKGSAQALPRVLRFLMNADIDRYSVAMDQAHNWYDRNLEKIERVEGLCQGLSLPGADDESSPPASIEPLILLRTEVIDGCAQNRRLASRILGQLDSTHDAVVAPNIEVTQAQLPTAERKFEWVFDGLMQFYAGMEEVESQIIESALQFVALQNCCELEKAVKDAELAQRDLEEKLTVGTDLRQQMERLQREIESRSAGHTTHAWIQLENEANQREVRALEASHAQLQQRNQVLEKEIEDSKKEVEIGRQARRELDSLGDALTRLRHGSLGATVKDIEKLTSISPPKLSQQAIDKRIKKLQKRCWLPMRGEEEKKTTYYFTTEQVKIIIAFPGVNNCRNLNKFPL